MATYYVNKSGNDGNAGTSAALARLTVQAGMNLCASGDTLIVGSGRYNEAVTFASGTRTLSADGIVFMDGTGLGTTNGAIRNTSNATTSLIIGQASGGGKWIFANYTTGTAGGPAVGGTTAALISINVQTTQNSSVYLTNVELYGTGTQWGVQSTCYNYPTVSLTNCILSGFNYGAVAWANNVPGTLFQVQNCTFYNNTVHTYSYQTGAYGVFLNNIFSGGTTALYRNGTGGSTATVSSSNFNYFYSVTNVAVLYNGSSTTAYTTLANWQAAFPLLDVNSSSSNPNMADPANKNFFLTSQIAQYPATERVGRYSYTPMMSYASSSDWNVTGTADNTGWYNADGNITEVSNQFQLTSGTSGVIVSPVYDAGAVGSISSVNLISDQVWGTNMIDTTKTDVQPNVQTIEIRASNSSFNQDASTPAWTEVRTDIDFSPLTGRYAQLRLTFRSDDTAA